MSLIGAQAGTLSRAEAVLAALDDEQRAAAQAVTGPGLHPRRCGHRQDPHDHPPHRLRRAHRCLRPRAGARGDLHGPGGRRAARPAGRARRRRGAGAHLPRRGHAAAALLRAPGARRPDALAGREQAAAGGHGGLPLPAVHRPDQPARPGERDRVGEDDAGHARRLPGPREGGRPGAAVRGGGRGRGVRELRVGQAARRRARLRGPAAGHRLRAGGAPDGRPRGARRSTGTSSSTSTRTSTRCSSGCSTPGSAAGPRSASSATPTRRSTPSPAPIPTTCSGFADRYPDAAVVKLERDYRSTPQVVGAGQPADRPGAAAQGPARAAAAGPAARRPRAHVRRAPRRAGRGGRRRGALPGAHRRRARRRPRSPCCSASTPSRRSTRRR